MNASHSVGSEATEWEVAITMGDNYDALEDKSWQTALEMATAGNPTCTSYAGGVQKLVELYGGGEGYPLIHEQDCFSKTMSENKRRVEEFTRAIV